MICCAPVSSVILQGEADDVVPASQSQLFYDRLMAGGVPARLVMAKNANHNFAPTGGAISPSRAELSRLTADFLGQYLR
ncbi:MAG: prolyl oligopeptidase family serine peptidase [Chloroflexota bacterium]|nr:prolyl oligopeptidase family serine peptidase [Chloroflexota bacterium]